MGMNINTYIAQAFLSSSVLIIIILLLRAFCRKKISARIQYGIWLLVAVKLLLVPVPFVENHFSFLNLWGKAEEKMLISDTVQVEKGVVGTDVNEETTNYYLLTNEENVAYLPNEKITETTYIPTEKEVTVTTHNYEAMAQETIVPGTGENTWWEMFPAAIPYIICVNAIVFAFWLFVYNIKFYVCLKKTRVPFQGNFGTKKDAEAKEKPGKPDIYLVEKLASPCLYGMSIYLPMELAKDETKLRHILAHETAHYRHKDFIWSFIRLLCLVLNWYNPFVWLASAAVKEDCELACDEAAIRKLGEEERVSYGETLLSLLGTKEVHDTFCATTMMIGSKQEMKRRISLIAEGAKNMLAVVVFTVATLAAAVLFTFTGEVQAADTVV